MIENLITMVKMIAFSYQYAKETGWSADLKNTEGVSPQKAMSILFGG